MNFEHEFAGREALLEIAENPPRVPITLEWDPSDVADIYASQFSGSNVDPYDRIDFPNDCFSDVTHAKIR